MYGYIWYMVASKDSYIQLTWEWAWCSGPVL
jgi:hypothetical protein